MTLAEISADIAAHKVWLESGCAEGKRINWRGKDLNGADLRKADLRWADLRKADLRKANLTLANLTRADLTEADLTGADLWRANLTRADLTEADLTGADLWRANLTQANLTGADLSEANLTRADLSEANFYRANLMRADLTQANLTEANLTDATTPDYQLCPQKGSFIAYKSVLDPKNNSKVVLKLEISGDRTSSLVGRKCRASKVRVISAIDSAETEFVSTQDKYFKYTVGAEIERKDYDPDIRVECTQGIHFFMTQKEAAEY